MNKWIAALAAPVAGIAAVATHDLLQRKHAILHNFPVIGHLRYLLESIGPELRQYIVSSNDEERPFSRSQRRWVYASAKLENNYFGFGTEKDMESAEGYPIIKQRTFSRSEPLRLHERDVVHIQSGKILGGPRGRAKAFRPRSVINISAMSFGALSGAAVTALNKGAGLANCLQNTGEGGISPYHHNGGDLIWQLGTAYFGCRTEGGRFDLAQFKDKVASAPVKAIEIKLSQGAKPGLGGVLPAAKISAEIAETRGVPMGENCISPARHPEFDNVDAMLDFIEMLAAETGLPVGIKSAVGADAFWVDLARQMAETDRGADFITVDGSEGGTGAGPLTFTDSVALPFRIGFSRVYRRFAEAGITDQVTFIGSGKLGLPDNAIVAFALGCDMVNVAREAMLSIGCIQAQLCHTNRCPTGVTTQNPRLAAGLDSQLKSVRAFNYLRTWRRDVLEVSEACGVPHPSLITPDDVEIVSHQGETRTLRQVFGYQEGWGVPAPEVFSLA